MPLLLRHLPPKRAGLWAAATDPNKWKSGNFPYELLYDLHDPRGGLSFYEVSTRRDPDIRRVAAALNFSKDSIESADFRFVHLRDVANLGLAVTTTPGATKDTYVNSLHREITGLDARTVVKLARLMCLSDNVVLKAKRVASEISNHVRKGDLPNPPHALLKYLIQEDAVKIQYL